MTRAHRQDWDRQVTDRHLTAVDEPPVPRPPGGETASELDRQPTHRIVATDRQDDDRQPGRLVAALSGLRFMEQAMDRIDYARNGAYSIQVDGWWRNANIWFVSLVAIPGMIVCDSIKWALFERLPRTLVSLIVIPLALMLLNGLPVIAWLVPDWADFTTWGATETVPGAVG